MSAPWALHHGDCLPWLRSLPDKSVDHAIMDPPYSAHVHANARSAVRKTPLTDGKGRIGRAQRDRAISRGVDFGFAHVTPETITAVAAEVSRVVRRWTLIFSDVESCHLWRAALEAAELDYARTMIWQKLGAPPQFSGDRPAVACEAITLVHPKGRKRWNGGGKHGFYTTPIAYNQPGKPDYGRTHPTQKPLELMLALVADFTDPGDIILDPFAGSGTTGVAALRLGRRFTGAEQDATHYATACERLTAEERGQTLAQARAGQLSLLD